jgi:hypothetical protein
MVGAIVGAVVTAWYEAVTGSVSRFWTSRALSARRMSSADGTLRRRLVGFYRSRDLLASLYSPTHIRNVSILPMLVDQAHLSAKEIPIESDDIFVVDRAPTTRFEVSSRRIAWLRRRRVRLFNGRGLYARSFELEAEGPHVLVGRYEYYAYADLSVRLRREILSHWRPKRLLQSHFTSMRQALGNPLQPQAVGCICVVALCAGEDIVVPIARRSIEVLTNPGLLSLVPAFGFEANTVGDRESRYGLPFHNVVREFSEEFFNLDDLVELGSARRRDPDWFFRLDPAVAVVAEAVAGRLTLTRLGLSVHPADGSLNVILLAHFREESFYRWLEAELTMNWEAEAPEAGDGPVEFMSLFGPRLDDLVRNFELETSSAFALDLARKYFSSSV